MHRLVWHARLALAACIAFPFTQAHAAESAPQTRVMILASHHFANPGRDVHNVQVDDVLAPKRQAEIAAVVDALAAFKPTVVAVEEENDGVPGYALKEYGDYLAGTLKPKASEHVQIGYRLAKQVGLKQVHGIDIETDFPFEAVQEYAKKYGRMPQFQAINEQVGQEVQAFGDGMATRTVAQNLRWQNDPARIHRMHGYYMLALPFGQGAEQPGANLVSAWVSRNIAICARLAQVLKPGDRAVVVYGAGHAATLRQCVLDMPGWALVEASDYLPMQ